MNRRKAGNKTITPAMRALLIRLGIIAPDTAFNRRAAAYAAKAVQDERNRKWREKHKPKA